MWGNRLHVLGQALAWLPFHCTVPLYHSIVHSSWLFVRICTNAVFLMTVPYAGRCICTHFPLNCSTGNKRFTVMGHSVCHPVIAGGKSIHVANYS